MKGGNDVLIAVDNCQSIDASPIFSIVKRVFDFKEEIRDRIRFVLAARQPEFQRAIDGNLFGNTDIGDYIRYFFDKEPLSINIGNFSSIEIKEFIEKYTEWIPPHRKKDLLQQENEEIKNINGYPIMVKFMTLNKGLDSHVTKMYYDHLSDESQKPSVPYKKRIEMIILNSLFDITTIPLSDEDIKYFDYIEESRYLEDTIIKKKDNVWQTIHPIWDLHLLKYMFSLGGFHISTINDSFTKVTEKIFNYQGLSTLEKVNISDVIFNTLPKNEVTHIEKMVQLINPDKIFETLNEQFGKMLFLVYVISVPYINAKNHHQNEKALAWLEKAVIIDPEYASAYYNKGIALTNLERYDEAIKNFDKAIKVKPNHTNAYNNKGNTLGNPESFDKFLKMKPDHAGAYYGKGIALTNLERYDEALECFDKAIKVKPDHAGAYYGKGIALAYHERYDEALECFNYLLLISPNDEKVIQKAIDCVSQLIQHKLSEP